MMLAREGIMDTLLGATFAVNKSVQSVLRYALIVKKQAKLPESQFSRPNM